MMQHLCENNRTFGDKSDEVSKMGVADIDHRGNRKHNTLILLLSCLRFNLHIFLL